LKLSEKIKIFGYLVILTLALAVLKFLSVYEFNSRKNKATFEIAWVEEFENDTLNNRIWTTLENQSPTHELQSFSNRNCYIKNGKLVLEVLFDPLQFNKYISANLKGIKSMDFDTGYVEVKIKPIKLEGVQNRVILKNSNGNELPVVMQNGTTDSKSTYLIVKSEIGTFDFSQPFTINITAGVSEKYLITQSSIQSDFFPQQMEIDYIKFYKKVNQKMLF